jgi:2-polyprenyl-3-methyl-5-hydroxy-6-metoxy-1,4-benzoquinol methylase
MRILRQQLDRHPQLKAALKKVLRKVGVGAGVSSRYLPVPDGEASLEAARLRAAWQAQELPWRQRELVDQQLAAWRRGDAVDVFDVMVGALQGIAQRTSVSTPLTLLEVGCSSGFYSEVVEVAPLPVQYAGCDYSEAFVTLARKIYPHIRFSVDDATALSYAEGSFDIVVSGCCLLHIPEYEIAVAETARVARRWAIFHRTPMVIGEPNRYYRKLAYGIETVEIHFNELAFVELLEANGLKVVEIFTLAEDVRQGIGTANRTYVCEKVVTS